MKRFSFPLDRVLVWRRLEMDREQALLQRLLAERKVIEQKESTARSQRLDSERLISTGRYIDAQFVSTLPDWQNHMKKAISQLSNDLRASDQKVLQQQLRFQQAKRNVGLLERLREKRLDQWTLELGREEEAFAAEAFLSRSISLKRRSG